MYEPGNQTAINFKLMSQVYIDMVILTVHSFKGMYGLI